MAEFQDWPIVVLPVSYFTARLVASFNRQVDYSNAYYYSRLPPLLARRKLPDVLIRIILTYLCFPVNYHFSDFWSDKYHIALAEIDLKKA